MRRFRFNLERVLRLKLQLRRLAEQRQLQAHAAWEAAEREVARLQSRLAEVAEAVGGQVGQPRPAADWLFQVEQAGRVARELESARQHVEQAAQQSRQELQPRTRALGNGHIKTNGLLLAAAHRDQNALEGPQGSFFTLALVHEMLAKQAGTLADVWPRTIATTQQLTQNRQEPEAVGDMEVGRHVVFSE